jgi:hypothetical protein
VFTDAIAPEEAEARRWTMALFHGIHTIFLSWIITGLNIAAIYFQVREIRSRPRNHAFSHVSLAIQAAVFAFVAISWIGRVKFPYEGFSERTWGFLSTWFELVGWAAVDNGIFAIGQAVLLWGLLHQERSGAYRAETEPLLRA